MKLSTEEIIISAAFAGIATIASTRQLYFAARYNYIWSYHGNYWLRRKYELQENPWRFWREVMSNFTLLAAVLFFGFIVIHVPS